MYMSHWAPEVSQKTAILFDIWKNPGVSPPVILSQINISKSSKKCIGVSTSYASYTSLILLQPLCTFLLVLDSQNRSFLKDFPKFIFFKNSKIYIQGEQFYQFHEKLARSPWTTALFCVSLGSRVHRLWFMRSKPPRKHSKAILPAQMYVLVKT